MSEDRFVKEFERKVSQFDLQEEYEAKELECIECEEKATSRFNNLPYCDFHFSQLDELGNKK